MTWERTAESLWISVKVVGMHAKRRLWTVVQVVGIALVLLGAYGLFRLFIYDIAPLGTPPVAAALAWLDRLYAAAALPHVYLIALGAVVVWWST